MGNQNQSCVYDGRGYVDKGVVHVTVEEGVLSIPDEAFKHCESMMTIIIPSSVTSIGEGAFQHCKSLTTIDVPASITTIGYRAFIGCTSLSSIRIPSNAKVDDNAFEKTTIIHYYDINKTNSGNAINTITKFVLLLCILYMITIGITFMVSKASSEPTETIQILNDIVNWPPNDNDDLQIIIESDQFLDPEGSIQLSKQNMNNEFKVIFLKKEEPNSLHGQIVYSYGLWKKKIVSFQYNNLKPTQTISVTNLDGDSTGNINQLKLMDANNGNNLNDLPKEYRTLFSEEAYKFLIKGCTRSKNWEKIKKEGYVVELDNLFENMPEQKKIYCYLFTAKGETAPRNFAFARIDGAKVKKEELKTFAKTIRRIFTSSYDDVNSIFKESEEEFLEKLDKAKKQDVFSDWSLREYRTTKWFYNELPDSDKYQEVIFSSENGSYLNKVFACRFPEYIRGSKKWPLPSITEQDGRCEETSNLNEKESEDQQEESDEYLRTYVYDGDFYL